MNNRHIPTHPGAMTPAQIEYRFLCKLAQIVTGATATAIFAAALVWLS